MAGDNLGLRAFLLAGTQSGSGKTTLTAGLLRALRNQGRAVAPFKCGPDFLDPQLHQVAAGRACWNLDSWFMDSAALAETFARGSAGADGALVEGAMGLFDGADPVSFQGSSADIARRLGLPVVLALDGSAVGGSIAATVLGHDQLWPELRLAGVIFNRVASAGHYRLLQAAVAATPRCPCWVTPGPAVAGDCRSATWASTSLRSCPTWKAPWMPWPRS